MLHEASGSVAHTGQTPVHLSGMKRNAVYRLSAVAADAGDHEIVVSACSSPLTGAVTPSQEDTGLPCGEIGPYGCLSFHSSEDPTQSGFPGRIWPGTEVVPSAGSSPISALTPLEGTASPPSYADFPTPDDTRPSTLARDSLLDLETLAVATAEAGMQSPASFCPESPGDSFLGSDVHGLPPSSLPSSPAAQHGGGTNMDISSGPRVLGDSNARLNTGDKPYAQLLRDCFLSRPDHSMSLKEIYLWFETNTSKGALPGKGWQNSIRHNLSMNAAFKKQDTTHHNVNTGRGASRPRSNIWTMEKWAVDGRVLSTTRYRKQSSSRRNRPTPAHLSARAYGYRGNHFVLSGGENGYSHGMDRAAAGRRGGVATANARERRRTEGQTPNMATMPHPVSVMDMSHPSWAVPRTVSAEMVSNYHIGDHFNMAGPAPGVHGYMPMQGGAGLVPHEMYGAPLTGSAHQSHRQYPHQRLGTYSYGASGASGDFTSANTAHAVHHQSATSPYGSNFGAMNQHNVLKE